MRRFHWYPIPLKPVQPNRFQVEWEPEHMPTEDEYTACREAQYGDEKIPCICHEPFTPFKVKPAHSDPNLETVESQCPLD